MKKVKTKDQRQHKRLNAIYLVKYVTGRPNEPPKIRNIRDVSAGGVKFISDHELEAGSVIRVNVLVPPLVRSFSAQAKVLRVNRAHKKNLVYSVAVQFINISEEDKVVLNNFVESIMRRLEGELHIDHANVVIRHTP